MDRIFRWERAKSQNFEIDRNNSPHTWTWLGRHNRDTQAYPWLNKEIKAGSRHVAKTLRAAQLVGCSIPVWAVADLHFERNIERCSTLHALQNDAFEGVLFPFSHFEHELIMDLQQHA